MTASVFVEVFSGSGRLGAAVADAGWPVLLWDLALGPAYDLRLRRHRSLLLGWVRAGLVRGWHGAFPCASFSRARDQPNGPPRLRSPDEPGGLSTLVRDTDREAVDLGNLLVAFMVTMASVSILHLVPWSMENPAQSYAWLVAAMQRLLRRRRVVQTVAEFCQFGTPWRKSTRFVTFLVDFSAIGEKRCTGRVCARTARAHLQLCGKAACGTFRTKIAEAYPPALCRMIATAFVNERARARAKQLELLTTARPE